MGYWVYHEDPYYVGGGGGRGGSGNGKLGCGFLLCIAIGLLVHILSGRWIFSLAAFFITLVVALFAEYNDVCLTVIEVLGFVSAFVFVLMFNGAIYLAFFAGAIVAGILYAVFSS